MSLCPHINLEISRRKKVINMKNQILACVIAIAAGSGASATEAKFAEAKFKIDSKLLTGWLKMPTSGQGDGQTKAEPAANTRGESWTLCKTNLTQNLALSMVFGAKCADNSKDQCNYFQLLAYHSFLYDAYPISGAEFVNLDSVLPNSKFTDEKDVVSNSKIVFEVTNLSPSRVVRNPKFPNDPSLNFSIAVKIVKNEIIGVSDKVGKQILHISANRTNEINQTINSLVASKEMTFYCEATRFDF